MATRQDPSHASAKAGVLTGLVLGGLFAGLPVLWMLSTSFKTNGEVFQNPPRLITKGFSFDAYREIFGNSTQLRFFLNSYVVAALGDRPDAAGGDAGRVTRSAASRSRSRRPSTP